MYKPCFVYKQKDQYFILDIPGQVFGVGSTPEQAIADAMSNGVGRDEIEEGF